MVEMTQPVNSTQGAVKREAFFFRTSRYQRVNAGLFERKMPTYIDYGGWVISTIAGWVDVTADTLVKPGLGDGALEV